MRRFWLAACERSVKARLTRSDSALRAGPRAARRPLLRIRAVLARPGAGGVGERRARAAVDRHLGGAEDRALHSRGRDDLAPRRIAMLGLRRLLVVDQTPDL